MEGREGMSSLVSAADVPRSESTSQPCVTAVVVPPVVVPPVVVPPVVVPPVGVALAASATQVKKKRGRPRKYGPDGSVSLALSPMPISSSAPAGSGMGPGDFPTVKRSRGRPAGSLNKPKIDFDPSGEWGGCSVGGNFTPHVITVAAGEDVTMKIISFSQQGPRAICILSANGAISNVTLRQPDSSGGTLTYEGRFEILSLSGSFMPTESGGTRSRSGGMSVSLASPDGRVVGGGIAGLLVAASPVQVVVGSFMPNMQDQKPKKPKMEFHTSLIPTAAVPISSAEMHEVYSTQGQRLPTTPRPNLAPSSSFRGDNWGTLHSMPEGRNSSSTDINISLPGG
ncbi:AT-hook motif nuclear-localized protein 1-like [Aristolochia californica]|uniref:AT-hook motif nuclear-localized protein 1-like n=1 Tax=Aristolochia californica TaxID=171875 RepID=UPI0035E1ED64